MLARSSSLSLALLATAALVASGCTAASMPTGASASRAEGGLSAPVKGIAPKAPSIGSAADMPSAGASTSPGGASAAGEMAAPVDAPASSAKAQEALKAGAVDDNAKFEEYLTYRSAFSGTRIRQLDVKGRRVLRVVDADGKTVDDATVTVSLGDETLMTARSYANGELLFHPHLYPAAEQTTKFQVKATKGEATASGEFDSDAEGVWELKLSAAVAPPSATLDVAFVLDATGSMGGEISQLQATIKSIASRIQALPQQPNVRFGLVSYRDQKETYVTRKTDFTSDIDAFQAALDEVSAGGGGDKPEDMESGLAVTLGDLSWKPSDAVRLSFVVADAGPHVDYEQGTPYTSSMRTAAEKGVKLFTIGTSGLETDGEYVMRQLAQFTMAQYLFVTRGGDEGADGGGAASATVDKFKEGRLDDIVVDIVKSEMDHLAK